MTSLLRRAATCAGLAACGFSALSQAQSTTTVLPQRTTDLRRLPVATTTVATAPIVQQSPNGLYKLSIGDTGIELLGPQGSVKISDAGIEIGGPGNTQITIRGGQTVKLEAGRTMDIKGGAAVQLTTGSGTMKLDAGATLTGSRVLLGCTSTNGRPAARLGDQVNTTASPAVIAQGSPTVLVC
jgi:uncharacterized Zn-binding protein involved in type VI secretion